MKRNDKEKKTSTFRFVLTVFGLIVFALLVGYLSVSAWRVITLWSTRINIVVTALLVLILVLFFLRWLIIKKGKQFFSFLYSLWLSINTAFANNPNVKDTVARHPSFFKLLKERFNKNSFWGLPLTLLILSFSYVLLLSGGIVSDVIRADAITSIDIRIMNLLYLFRSDGLTHFFLWITLLGKWQIVLGFLTAIIGVLWVRRKKIFILPLLFTVISAEVFVAISKIVFHRPRPELALYTEHTFSFPSGHATVAVAFYGFITYLLIRHADKWKTRINIAFAGLGIMLLIGFSRLYLGVHYLSDVLGGYLIGALWLILGISIAEWLVSRIRERSRPIRQTKTRVITWLLILLSLSFYISFGLNYHPPLNQGQTIEQSTTSVQDVKEIFTDEQLKYTETLTGTKQEPLSFIVIADNDAELVNAFEQAGWHIADNVDIRSLARIAIAAVSGKQYLNAPMTPSFWNKETHTFGFEKPTIEDNVQQRHHARFWRTNYITIDGKKIYVGTASLDEGIKWGVTHRIAPDIDTEREKLFTDLRNAGVIESFQKQQFVKPEIGENFAKDQFFTDGEAYVLYLNNVSR